MVVRASVSRQGKGGEDRSSTYALPNVERSWCCGLFKRKNTNKAEPSHPKERPSPTPPPVTTIVSTHHPLVEGVQPEIQITASEAGPEIDHNAEIQQHQYCAAYAYTMLRPAVPPKAST
ncbi:hypothetical protein M231_01053 [Tremella mesenterica]|uniref:Uncharacterized protein n=1 Tax=Tremella mesenterica TaxID=5217 RepID=A0A4Q1BTY8_TREME|nr:hypothetical protein M231_01053 [Tremella mesenterica]